MMTMDEWHAGLRKWLFTQEEHWKSKVGDGRGRSFTHSQFQVADHIWVYDEDDDDDLVGGGLFEVGGSKQSLLEQTDWNRIDWNIVGVSNENRDQKMGGMHINFKTSM